jgi:hypothetical protein
MQSYRAVGYGRLSLLSFLTHYLLYLEIETSDELCITSYCDNYSLLKSEEASHTRDIDSSSWYTNHDHDVIMTLSALRTKLPLRVASLYVRAHQDESCEFNLLRVRNPSVDLTAQRLDLPHL